MADTASNAPSPNMLKAELIRLVLDLSSPQQAELLQELQDRFQEKSDDAGESAVGSRAHPRKRCLLLVDCMAEDQVQTDFVRDISPGGAFIVSNRKYAIGDQVNLLITMEKNEPPVKLAAEVTRWDADGIGMKFIDLDEDQKATLQNTLTQIHSAPIQRRLPDSGRRVIRGYSTAFR